MNIYVFETLTAVWMADTLHTGYEERIEVTRAEYSARLSILLDAPTARVRSGPRPITVGWQTCVVM